MERNNLGKVRVEIEVIECKGVSSKTGKPYNFYDYRRDRACDNRSRNAFRRKTFA